MAQRTLRNVVNGDLVSSSGSLTELINPSTGEVFALAPNSTASEVDSAYQAAAAAFPAWRDSTPAVRQKALLAIADDHVPRRRTRRRSARDGTSGHVVQSGTGGNPCVRTIGNSHEMYGISRQNA